MSIVSWDFPRILSLNVNLFSAGHKLSICCSCDFCSTLVSTINVWCLSRNIYFVVDEVNENNENVGRGRWDRWPGRRRSSWRYVSLTWHDLHFSRNSSHIPQSDRINISQLVWTCRSKFFNIKFTTTICSWSPDKLKFLNIRRQKSQRALCKRNREDPVLRKLENIVR